MFEKPICRRALLPDRAPAAWTVTYWDGQSERYGPGPWLRLRLRSPRAIWGICQERRSGRKRGDTSMATSRCEGDLAEFVALGEANGERLASLLPEGVAQTARC